MAEAGLTHSQLATKLIVEGCIAHVAGNVQGKMPIAPIPLTELERADISLKQGGHTVFYPLPPTGVFLDLHGPASMVWFTGSDVSKALGVLEAELKRKYPRAKQLKDSEHPQQRGARLRTYEVELGGSRVAALNIEYPTSSSASQFRAQIVAMARR